MGRGMSKPYRILVTGSREWNDEQGLRLALISAWTPHQESAVIVHGACPRGADAMADEWASNYGVPVEKHPADWSEGKSAGFRRNAEMVSLGADVVLAFIRNGSRGATHCADEAEKAGIRVRRFLA